jgi:hypothetical protein
LNENTTRYNGIFSRSRLRPYIAASSAAALDFPARDHALVEQLRNKGAVTLVGL